MGGERILAKIINEVKQKKTLNKELFTRVYSIVTKSRFDELLALNWKKKFHLKSYTPHFTDSFT